MTEHSRTIQGACLCGAVRYELHGAPGPVINCHCQQCRKQTGHFLAATDVALADLALTESRGLAWYQSSDFAKRGFCKLCGSTLFWQRLGSAEISIAAGSLEGATGLATTGHIYVDFKGDYYELDGHLPRWPAGQPG